MDKLLSGEVRNNTEYCMTPNGAFFRKDIKGFLPELMEQIYNDRVKYKKLLLQAEQGMRIPRTLRTQGHIQV